MCRYASARGSLAVSPTCAGNEVELSLLGRSRRAWYLESHASCFHACGPCTTDREQKRHMLPPKSCQDAERPWLHSQTRGGEPKPENPWETLSSAMEIT